MKVVNLSERYSISMRVSPWLVLLRVVSQSNKHFLYCDAMYWTRHHHLVSLPPGKIQMTPVEAESLFWQVIQSVDVLPVVVSAASREVLA